MGIFFDREFSSQYFKLATYSYSTVKHRSESKRSEQPIDIGNNLAFRFFMINNSLKSMKTSFVFVGQEIRKQNFHEKFNRVNKSHAFCMKMKTAFAIDKT